MCLQLSRDHRSFDWQSKFYTEPGLPDAAQRVQVNGYFPLTEEPQYDPSPSQSSSTSIGTRKYTNAYTSATASSDEKEA